MKIYIFNSMIIQRLIKILFISFSFFFNIKFSVVSFSSPLMSSDVLFFHSHYLCGKLFDNWLFKGHCLIFSAVFFINLKQQMDKISQSIWPLLISVDGHIFLCERKQKRDRFSLNDRFHNIFYELTRKTN